MTLDSFQKKFHLTPRQRQVAELLAAGESRKEIAASLGVSVWTVGFHVVNVRHKLGSASTLRAVAKISRHIM